MRSSKAARVGLVSVGVVAAAVVMAPASYGETARRDEDRLLRLATGADLGSGSQIGIAVRDLEDADVTREKLSSPGGAVIDEVCSQSPAAEAGLAAGDVVIEFDGEHVRSARQLGRLIQETPPGRTVSTVVTRDAARLELEVTPDMRSAVSIPVYPGRRSFSFTLPEISIPRFDLDRWVRPGRLGVRVEEIGPQLAEYFGVEEGVLVTSVTEDSPAAAAGLRAGDVITSVDKGAIDEVSGLTRRLSRIRPGEEFEIVVVRNKERLTLRVVVHEEDVERRRLRLRGWRRCV